MFEPTPRFFSTAGPVERLAGGKERARAPKRELTTLDVVLLGCGNVGGALLRLLPAAPGVRLIGIAARSRACLAARGIDPLAPAWASCSAPWPDLVDALECSPRAALVDCTAADGLDSLYALALRRGAHVVTANKKPFTIALDARARLFDTARAARRQLRYETTVGAGLPVIEPLKDLVRTGDELRRIEGSFSGTLGYLCGELGRGVPLSRAVASAKELGYTEPHPRDDLSGADVARKVLILAREAGLPLELEDVDVEPFVPARLFAEDDPARFLAALADFDAEYADRVRQHARDGRVPRYLARIDVAERRAQVGLHWVEASHPAAQLRGTESLVTYSTARYRDYPMRIQGPGAGAQVTAAGVLADLLAIARGA